MWHSVESVSVQRTPCSSLAHTVYDKHNKDQEPENHRYNDMRIAPRIKHPAPREAHKEKKQPSGIKEDSDVIQLLEFLPSSSATVVELIEIRRVIECHVTDQRYAIYDLLACE